MPRASQTFRLEARRDCTISMKRNVSSPCEMPARRSFEAFCSERGTMEPAMTPDDVIPLHLADVTYPASHPLAGQDGLVLAFAIRHPDGIVLVDTGVGEGDEWVAQNYRPRIRDVREALSAANLDPDAVRAIVNSHLHFDHCGQNRAFAGVPIYVQQSELDLALREGHTVVEWVDFPEARYEAIEGDREILPGVSVLATPGHTQRHQSVTVGPAAGPLLH